MTIIIREGREAEDAKKRNVPDPSLCVLSTSKVSKSPTCQGIFFHRGWPAHAPHASDVAPGQASIAPAVPEIFISYE